MNVRFGPVCHLDSGAYRAVERNGVLVVERADLSGAVRAVEWNNDAERRTWERALVTGPSATTPDVLPRERAV